MSRRYILCLGLMTAPLLAVGEARPLVAAQEAAVAEALTAQAPPPTTAPAVAVPPPTPTPQTTPRPGTPPVVAPQPMPAPPAGVQAAPPRRSRGRDVNVQIELTISDQIGSGTPEKKTVSMLVADGTMGRIRASATAQPPKTSGFTGPVGTGLNVDALPRLLDNNAILLELTVEYTPLRPGSEMQVPQRPTELNESISVILADGRSTIVSQAADPISDRKMTVEVKASVVK